MTKPTGDLNPAELSALRQQIDSIDDQLAELLLRRIALVADVGELKRRHTPGQNPIRPAREADMVRRIVAKFVGTPFPQAAAVDMWRSLIGACISVEAPLVVSVFAPEREETLYWLAREYYGSYISLVRQPHIKRVIGDIMDGKATVGIVPMLHSDDATFWWTNILQDSADMPKIFAHVPFASITPPGRSTPSGLAIGRVVPEPSGQDKTLIVIEAEANVSHSKLQTAMIQAKLEASWINIATLHPNVRHHLIEIKGFVTLHHESIQFLLSQLGSAVQHVSFLGAYAVPMNFHELDGKSAQELRNSNHASAMAAK